MATALQLSPLPQTKVMSPEQMVSKIAPAGRMVTTRYPHYHFMVTLNTDTGISTIEVRRGLLPAPPRSINSLSKYVALQETLNVINSVIDEPAVYAPLFMQVARDNPSHSELFASILTTRRVKQKDEFSDRESDTAAIAIAQGPPKQREAFLEILNSDIKAYLQVFYVRNHFLPRSGLLLSASDLVSELLGLSHPPETPMSVRSRATRKLKDDQE